MEFNDVNNRLIKPNVQTNKTVRPIIYCFTTPDNHINDGWCKIGYTDKQTADERIRQESFTSNTFCKKEWESPAIFDDYRPFTDHDFHLYLSKLGIERQKSVYDSKKKTEFFKISPQQAKEYLNRFKEMTLPDDIKREYTLRPEQNDAVNMMLSYIQKAERHEVLINAKPRFGKNLTVYDYIKRKGYTSILIVSNRPVIASSWYSDYLKFLGTDNYLFVSNCRVVKDEKYCLSRKEYCETINNRYENLKGFIEFVSLQDLKGSKWFSNQVGAIDKLKEVSDMNWDVLVVDESHEAADTKKTLDAFRQIKRKETIYLSGTPFKHIERGRFPKEGVFNWTYSDEQQAKEEWYKSNDEANPYAELPQLNLYTYKLDGMFADTDRFDEDSRRAQFFHLNEFFKTNENGRFLYDKDVDTFLDVLSSDEKYPLGSDGVKNQIKHSLWLLDRVDSVKALISKLKNHPNFKDYKIINAAGDGRTEKDDEIDEAFIKVKKAIKEHDKTITLSVGQLTTGVTIPELSAVFILCNIERPELYIQTSFRVQNPCLIKDNNGTFVRKENAYVFDFDPARTLRIMEQFANNLYSDTANGSGDTKQRAEHIEKLIKYFPIYGEDDDGTLVSYSPEDVIRVPSRILSKEVVKHGFMCNFLFQNIGRLFNDKKAMTIIDKVKEQKTTHYNVDTNQINYDENGNTVVKKGVIEEATEDVLQQVESELPSSESSDAALKFVEQIAPSQSFMDSLRELQTPPTEKVKQRIALIAEQYAEQRANRVAEVLTNAITNKYGPSIINTKNVEKDVINNYKEKVREKKVDHDIEMDKLKDEYNQKRAMSNNGEEIKKIVEEYNHQKEEKEFDFACTMDALENQFKKETTSETIQKIENNRQNKINKDAENNYAFPKLRAFARSISSFLMAYGDENTTCDKFKDIIPSDIFKEMTGIELEDYMYFIEKDYFDKIVFNDSIKTFIEYKHELANYFEDNHYIMVDKVRVEDVFDLIPPQKTNQIFTPKKVVQEMCDLLEENNPGCFDDPNKTFVDLYMKSGLYIAEIVKRLFRSEKMKELYPDSHMRLRHIFKYQVYGLAPTEIIYRIATNFVLGFDESLKFDESEHNLKQFDTVPYSRNGTLREKLLEVYPNLR